MLVAVGFHVAERGHTKSTSRTRLNTASAAVHALPFLGRVLTELPDQSPSCQIIERCVGRNRRHACANARQVNLLTFLTSRAFSATLLVKKFTSSETCFEVPVPRMARLKGETGVAQ
jgi:hypothetical protein